ncbi:MAG: peptidoglycan DD-metalloendopeptidase family protein [Candidatus Omnitrophica bacterium]|jgi:lipoprotein NlpD|nr:peptidoglycan DD-metalloendopeptidase family protein [Candidatus Omnitrophota bacterium]
MYILLFLSIILAFVSCTPATVTNQPCSYSTPSKNYQVNSSTRNTYLNFVWPLQGEVINNFGTNVNHTSNKGINIKAKPQDVVVASESGQAVFADHITGWGKTVILKHANNFYTVYANLNDIKIREGFLVKKGEPVGHVAQLTPDKEGILHFEIRKKHLADNPLRYLKAN